VISRLDGKIHNFFYTVAFGMQERSVQFAYGIPPSRKKYEILIYDQCSPQKHRGRDKGRVSALSSGAFTATLYGIVNRVKRGGRAPPILTSLG
jgi:hypothetical protein